MVQTNLSMFLKEDTPNYGEKNSYVHHPYVRENTILARQYQLDIARHALSRNTAVILPTGLGKTIIAFLVMADILPKRILFLAPTKPLVQQHYESFKKFLTVDEQAIQMLAGNISAKKRTAIFNQATIIVATPQTIQNDLKNKRYTLNGFGLVIFDEMHHAVERYAYVTIAKHCRCRILGLTASPGSKKKKINKILENLKIIHIESRIRDDFDVKDHVKEILIDWIKVPMDTNLRNIQKPLYDLYLEKLGKLNKLGILTYKKPEYLSKKDILGARATIQKRFRRKPFIISGGLLTVVCLFILSFLNPANALIPFAIIELICWVGVGFLTISLDALVISSTIETERGKINGITYAAQNVGLAGGAILLSFIAKILGYNMVFLTAGFIILPIVLFSFILQEKNRERTTKSRSASHSRV